MSIKLEHLKVFIAVAETGKLADAGAKIGRTPSAVSMTLHQIEQELGGALFEGDRKSRLTKLGRFVLVRAQRTVSEHTDALSDIHRFARGEEGIVRVAAVPSAATRLLPPAVEQLRETSDLLRVDLRDTDSVAVADAVRSGIVDFGIASQLDAASDINTSLLLEDPFRLICLSTHRLAKDRKAVRWQDIDPTEFIANGLCSQISNPELASLAAKSPLMVHNTTSLISFVANGFGITLLPALAAPVSPEFVALSIQDPLAVRQLYTLTRFDETQSPAAERLINLVRDIAKNIPPE